MKDITQEIDRFKATISGTLYWGTSEHAKPLVVFQILIRGWMAEAGVFDGPESASKRQMAGWPCRDRYLMKACHCLAGFGQAVLFVAT